MKYSLFSEMALIRDVPAHGLRRGDVVRVVDYHVGPDGREGYSIEVLNAVGETIAVTTADEAALEPLHRDEVFSVRRLRSSAA